MSKSTVVPVAVFALTLIVVLKTTAPTIYYLADSTEYAIGAKTLGIVHAPGYALYLLIGHLFTYLPVGDIGYRVNLFSSLSLALTALFSYAMLFQLVKDRAIAVAVTLTVVWSFHIWVNAVAAEVYIPQLAAISATGWALVSLYRAPYKTWRRILRVGVLYGVAVALNPSSVLLAPGMAVSFLMMRVPLRKSVAAGALAVGLVLLTLLYFPVRYNADPPYNAAGAYGIDGEFREVDLTTLGGVWWLVSGRQFDSLFFSQGYLPTPRQLYSTFSIFWGNYLGVGLLVAGVGCYVMYLKNRTLLVLWLVFFVPFTYFFSTYGANDRDTMLNPSLWLVSIPIAYGSLWFLADATGIVRWLAVLLLPTALLLVNFRIVDASETYFMRERAEFLIEHMPENAIVTGTWIDATMMQYMQLVEGRRPDLQVVNWFYFFDRQKWQQYLARLSREDTPPLVLLSEIEPEQREWLERYYTFSPISLDPEKAAAYKVDPLPQRLIP